MKESKTTYAYLIEHMQNPTFQKVWDIAYDFVNKLPSELCDELHESLNRGVDALDSEPLLQMYIYSFGKMHNAKLLHAFNHIQDKVIEKDKIEIIDYGCGQGLASLCYHDFIKERNPLQKVTKITLIEPSQLALSRAELLCSYFYPETEIVAVNKQFDDLTAIDINVSSEVLTLHLFSNILDVESFNLPHLIQTVSNLPSEKNEYVIVSPICNALKMQRLKTFAANIGGFVYYENYLDKRQLDEERDWTCAVLLCSSIITKKEHVESECDKVFEEACSIFNEKATGKNLDFSIELMQRLHYCAELGDKRCQNQLGLCFLCGVGTEKNYKLAYEWIKKAAEQDYAPALNNIGEIYRKGFGVEVDNLKAIQYIKEGAEKKHSGCQYKLGLYYLLGIGVDVDKNIAFSLFIESSLQGNTSAMFKLYECYLNSWGTEKNEKLAIKYLKKASKEKHAKSCYVLGNYYQEGEFVEKNDQKSLELYIASAELGYAPAQEKLGDVYRQGLLGCEELPKESFNWYQKAAEKGISSAQFYIGYYYASGYAVKKDEKLAFKWYTKAAEKNNSAALNNLAICYEYGRGTEINFTKAAFYYEESAKLGNVTAQKNISNCYEKGIGVKKDSNKVFYWTSEAARNGDIDSQGKVALYHLKGYSTDISIVEALLWYARYYSKETQIANADEAFDFFKKKADEGDAQSLYIVGKCLQYGVTTDKNIINAYTYFEKAAELGHIESLIKTHRVSSLYELCSIKEGKNTYKDDYGVKYSEDKKCLIDGGWQEGNEYRIATGTRVICDNAFGRGNFGKFIIPSSLIVIGNNPFARTGWGRCCVEQIECHSNMFVVSDYALYTKDKKKLISYLGKSSNVTIPEGVEIIGCNAFAENDDLIEIQFPETLCSIENAAFEYCLNLKQILLPENVKNIGERCFHGCESLEKILSLGGVKIISKEAFYGCNIKKLVLPTSLIEIDDNAFNSNRNLYSLTLPENVSRIGNYSFAFCSLQHVYLNDNLEKIGDFCFFKCPIESIAIPSSMKFIGINPFIGTKAIDCENNCVYASENGLLYGKQSGELISHYGETEIALYPPITNVNSFAFYNSGVTDIFLGSNIVKVSAWAFYNASKLEKVIWRNSKVMEIPIGCFGECHRISKIDVPSCVETIQKGAFFDCVDLMIMCFHGFAVNANENIFCRVDIPSCIPFLYGHRHPTGSTVTELSTVSDLSIYKREVDPSTFPIIEVYVPKGSFKNYSFSPIYDDNNTHCDNYYGMERQFVVIEDEKE